MITKEQLLNASTTGKRSHGRPLLGVLTKQQAEERVRSKGRLTSISNRYDENEVLFFSDDHCFGVGVLPDGWVSSSSTLPNTVVPREGLEDGIVNTVDKNLFIFHKQARVIQSIEELVEYLNQTK
jgi:hypothetical protein